MMDPHHDADFAARTNRDEVARLTARVAELEAETERLRDVVTRHQSERSFVVGWNDGFAYALRRALEVTEAQCECPGGLCGGGYAYPCQIAEDIRAIDIAGALAQGQGE